MNAHALKQLSRAELQKLAKSNNIKANGKSQKIIDELVKKYLEGVPKVAAPVPRASSRLQATHVTVENKKNTKEIDEDRDTGREAKVNKGEAKGQEGASNAQTADIAGLTSMSASQASIKVKPTTPTVAPDNYEGGVAGLKEKRTGVHPANEEVVTRVAENSEVEPDTSPNGTDVIPQVIESGPVTPEVAQHKKPSTPPGQEASSPNTSASGRGYRFGQPSASITGRRIAGGTRVSRYLATPRASLMQAGNRSSSSPQLATPDALAKLMPDESRGPREKPLSGSSQVYSQGRRRNIPASDDLRDGAMDNSKTPQSGASTSSSFPVRETPSPAPEREGATEAQAKAMLRALTKKVGELTYWRNELASAQYVMKQATERNKAIQEKIVEVQRLRKIAERFYMAALKKDERLHNGAKTWKPQEPEQPERDYSYVAEESEEQDTSDFVADSDESRPSADNADDAVDGEVQAGDEPQQA